MDLTDEAYNKQISDRHLEEITNAHCAKWRHLPPHLGLENIVKDDVDYSLGQERKKRFDFLTEWKQRKDNDATYKILIEALQKISCQNDAEYVSQLVQAASLSSTKGTVCGVPSTQDTSDTKGVCYYSY